MAQAEPARRDVIWLTLTPDLRARFDAFGEAWAKETGGGSKAATVARVLIVRALDAEEKKARKKGRAA